MKVGIFHEPAGGMGGAEFVTAVMADVLRSEHDVEIVHHRPEWSIEKLELFFELDLTGVRSRFLPLPTGSPLYSGLYLPAARHYWREWDADVSRPYDLFIANVHAVPPFCHAPRGVLHVLFPGFARSRAWPWGESSHSRFSRLLDPVRRPVYEAGWRERMGTYQTRLSISQYAARWTEEYWGVRTEVLYPPVLVNPANGPKENVILCLARFTPVKQQAELLKMFLDYISPQAPPWELVFVGGLSNRPEDQAYFAELQRAGVSRPVRFVPNASREQVRSELGRAKIYWHAMGLNVDPDCEPHKIEHFGIAPVEAMASGCVPVVLGQGGPAEVVRDGECGFSCLDLSQMAQMILRLTRDDTLRTKLAIAARWRAADFSVGRFKEQFRAYLDCLLGPVAARTE